MIKKSSIRRICVATLALFILLIIYFFPSSDVTIKEHLSYIKKDEMPIFLVDNSNYVARTSIVKSSETINEQIKEIIETLTINSKKSTYIRDGFKPIIPENTKIIDLKLDNEILTINFSKEFLTVNETNEELMLEALIYSLTELKEIKTVFSSFQLLMKSDLSILYRKHRTIFIIIQIEQLIKTPGRNTGKPDFLPTSSLYTCRFPASIVKIKQFIPVSPTHLIAVTWK